MPRSKKVVSKRKSKSLRGGSKTVSVLVGTKNKYRKHLNKSKRKRKSRRPKKIYKLNEKEIKQIINLIYQVYFKDKIESNKKDAIKEVELLEKLHKLLVNFEVKTDIPLIEGAYNEQVDLSKERGVYDFCVNVLESYLAFDRKETNLKPLKKHQKKNSSMKGGGYINYTFDLSSRISNMPPVIREYIV